MHKPPVPEKPALDFADISTHSSVLRDMDRMVLRYSPAILAYAAALLGDPQEAEDVHLTVVEAMLSGKFSAGARFGRFRFYVKAAVRNAVEKHLRGRSRRQKVLKGLWEEKKPNQRRGQHTLSRAADSGSGDDDLEEQQRTIWRQAVLEQVLQRLEEYQRQHEEQGHANVYHTLAQLLLTNPGDTSEQLPRRVAFTHLSALPRRVLCRES